MSKVFKIFWKYFYFIQWHLIYFKLYECIWTYLNVFIIYVNVFLVYFNIFLLSSNFLIVNFQVFPFLLIFSNFHTIYWSITYQLLTFLFVGYPTFCILQSTIHVIIGCKDHNRAKIWFICQHLEKKFELQFHTYQEQYLY